MPIKYPALKDIKNWCPEIEKSITDQWKNAELFSFNKNTKKKIYSIDTPPPYVNTPIHMGHAVTYCFMDMFARYRRMKNYEVLFPLGLDRNGLPIETAAEKKFNVSPFRIKREEFIALCEKLLSETSEESEESFARLGISFSSYKKSSEIGSVYLTDSPEYRTLTQSTFISLYKKGLIYEDSRINNWDPKLQTTVADAEIEYKEIPSTFNYVKWKVKETGEEIIIGTTRPELICTCGMVIFNPRDTRYQHLKNKTAITPLFNKEVKIQPHPLAQIEKGTGLVMMCSAGDLSDIQFFREQGLKAIIAINKDGTMNENAGFLQGLPIKQAREKIIALLKEKNLLQKQEQIMHRTPVSERSGAEIEFIEMPELYLKQLEIKKEIRKISEKINFYPPESKKILDSWISSINIDWPITRRRFYATPVPLWYSQKNNQTLTALPPEGEYYQPWKNSPPPESLVFSAGKVIGKVKDFSLEWKGDERVLDTWFDSSISELFILKYHSDDAFFKKAYPATLRPQGKEIVRTWLYYTLLRGYLETKKSPFKDVWIHQHILDEKGKKMSKSLGNVIDPKEILQNYGAESLRLWASSEGDLSKQDFACSKEKIKSELKTLNKILNVAKFVFQFEKPEKKPALTELDKAFIDYIENLTYLTDNYYKKYDFYHPSSRLKNFLWEELASHYLEIVKSRAYNKENLFSKEESLSAHFTLHFLLERFCVLIYPIIPQITSVIKNDIYKEKFPKGKKDEKSEEVISKIISFNKEVWKAKKEKNLSLKEPISEISIPKELKVFEKDLIACHNII